MTGDTKDRILDAATRLFHWQGYADTAVATILREAGVNSGSLYHFFASKEALLIAVLERYLETLDAEILGPAENAAQDPIERVFVLLESYRRGLLVTDCTRGCLAGSLALQIGDRMPDVRALIDRCFAAWIDGVSRWLEAAGDRLPGNLDREGLARFVHAVMQGAIAQTKAAGRLEPFDASIAKLKVHIELLSAQARREARDAPRERSEPGRVAALDRDAVPPIGDPSEADEAWTDDPAEWRSW